MVFVPDRRRRPPGRFLDWKVRLFFLAVPFLLVGMAREVNVLVAIGAGILVVAFLLRFFEKDEPEEDEPVEEDEIPLDGDDSAPPRE